MQFFLFFFLNNFIYKTITYTTCSINYTYIVLATNTTDTYTYTNYAYTTLRYMYYNTININLIYGWRVYKVLFMQFLSISYFHSLCAVSGGSGYNPEQSRKATIKQRPKHSFISFTHQRNEIVIFFYSEMN